MILVLSHLATAIHAGTLFSGAALVAMRNRLSPLREADLIRCFRATGAILGVSLGVFLGTEAALWPGRVNPGARGLDMFAVHADLDGLRLLVLGAYWVSYVVLEIWTLEPCRLLDRDGELLDPPRYAATAAAVSRHLLLNAALFLTVVALG